MNFIKKITTLFMFAAAAFAVSCSEVALEDVAVSDDATVSESIFSDREISFSLAELPTTRGAILNSSTFREFTIYATFSAYPTALSTRTMSVDENGLWVLNEPLTMPMTGDATFYAVNSREDYVTFNSDGSVSFAMSNVKEQSSILMSVPITVAEEDTDLNVAFSFKHALAAVGFKAAEGDYELTTVEISNFYDVATVAFGETYTASSYTYGSATTTVYETGSLDDSDDNYIILPAQSMEGVTVTAYMSYYEDGVEVDSYPYTTTLDANTYLETPGMVYTYNVPNSTYVAPDYITPGESYEDTDENGAYELGDVLVGGDVTANVESNSTLTWASSDESVATVDSYGKVTGIGGGTATITATSAADGVVIKFEVTVWTPIYGATVSKSTLTLDEDANSSLAAAATYEGAYSEYQEPYTVAWSTSAATVATVSSGTVTGKSAGTATITATVTGSMSGNVKTATCAVTVEKAEFDYTALSKGTYIDANGDITTSSSSAVAMVYYVDYTEEFALAVSTETYTRVYQWCSDAYTSTRIYASSYTDGYANTKTMKTKFGTTASTVNPVAYTQSTYSTKLANLTNVYDGAGKGEFYMPSLNELYLLFTALYNKSGYTLDNITGVSFSSVSTGTVYSAFTAAGGPKMTTMSACSFVSSTETAASTHRGLSVSDVSGYSTEKYKSTLCYSTDSSAWSSSTSGHATYYVIPIIKL